MAAGERLVEHVDLEMPLTLGGDGHTSTFYLSATRDAIDAYLVTGVTPPPNIVLES